VTDSEQLFEAVEAIVARDPAQALRAAARLGESGRDPGQVLRDLEVHARELLAVQVLGEVPAELRVTPERDGRLVAQANSLASGDAVRLLDLVAQALEATSNGAQARIQLELVLVKAAAPQLDPSQAALLARIERLEGNPGGDRPPKAPSAPPAPPQGSPAPAGASPAPTDDPSPSLELQTAVDSWPAVVELVGRENALAAAVLQGARPVDAGERSLVLAFPPGAEFAKRKAEQDDYRRVAMEALRTVTGHRMTLTYELRDNGDADSPAAPGALSGEELVRRLMEEFDAEEILDDDPARED
jgi:DNA polymerase-3 subunit gamma/tau